MNNYSNTIQGTVARSVDNSVTMINALDYVTKNITNYNTTGYKSERFEFYLKENGMIEGKERVNYDQGPILYTKRELDVAVDGKGFIPVTRPDGKTVFTRDGSFTVDKDGYLVTSENFIVGSGIKMPSNYYSIKIDKNGSVSYKKDVSSEDEPLGKIPLVLFKNNEGLKNIEGNYLVETEESGKPVYINDHEKIQQAKLENANVNLHEAVEEIMRINGSIITGMKVLRVTDEFYRQSVSLRQG